MRYQLNSNNSADFSDTWLIIPCYNEGQVIQRVIENARAVFPNIVAVNDGSHDDSAYRIHAGGAHLVNHPVNLGQGASIQTGVEYAPNRWTLSWGPGLVGPNQTMIRFRGLNA